MQVLLLRFAPKWFGKDLLLNRKPIFIKFLMRLMTLFGLIKLQFLNIDPKKVSIKTVQEGDCVPDKNGLQIINTSGNTPEQIAIFTR